MKTKLCNCNICVEGLGQSNAGSLVGGLVSVNHYVPRLIDYVHFLVLSLTFLAPTILPTPLQ